MEPQDPLSRAPAQAPRKKYSKYALCKGEIQAYIQITAIARAHRPVEKDANKPTFMFDADATLGPVDLPSAGYMEDTSLKHLMLVIE